MPKLTALVTGSFDPPTLGHLDIIARSAAIYDRVVVCIFHNSAKHTMFTLDERVKMLERIAADFDNVEIDTSEVLVADYVREKGIDLIVKGVRNSTDFEYETTISEVNKVNAPEVETFLLPCAPQYRFISSTIARELIRYGKGLEQVLPPAVIELIKEKAKH